MGELPRYLASDRFSIQLFHEVKHDVANCIDTAGAIESFFMCYEAFSLQLDVGITLGKFIEETPVGGGRPALE